MTIQTWTVLLASLLCSIAFGQTTQETQGDCSPIILYVDGDVRINCTLYSKELKALSAQLSDIQRKVGPDQINIFIREVNALFAPVIKSNQAITKKLDTVATKADVTELRDKIIEELQNSQTDPAKFAREAQHWKTKYEIKTYLAVAATVVSSDPIEAFLLAQKAYRLEPSAEAISAKQAAVRELHDNLNRRRSYASYSKPSGWIFPSGVWFYGKDFSVSNRDHTLLLGSPEMEEGRGSYEVLLTDVQVGQIKKLPPACRSQPTRISAIQFSKSQKYILVARHAFLSIYNVKAELVAEVCHWYTKDQWMYLDLLNDDSLLLASAGKGQVMLFTVDFSGTGEKIKPLTGEFDNRVRGGPIVLLQANSNESLLLSTHYSGYAYLWRFNRMPQTPRRYLEIVYRFQLPTQPTTDIVKLGLHDKEFITLATMGTDGQETYFLTTAKAGPAVQWQLQENKVVQTRVLAHGKSSVLYAAFSSNATKMLTLADDSSIRIWDTPSGTLLDEDDASWAKGLTRGGLEPSNQ